MALDRSGVRCSTTGQESVMEVGPFQQTIWEEGTWMSAPSYKFQMKALASCVVTGTRPTFPSSEGSQLLTEAFVKHKRDFSCANIYLKICTITPCSILTFLDRYISLWYPSYLAPSPVGSLQYTVGQFCSALSFFIWIFSPGLVTLLSW